jgi:hypothetical protein
MIATLLMTPMKQQIVDNLLKYQEIINATVAFKQNTNLEHKFGYKKSTENIHS